MLNWAVNSLGTYILIKLNNCTPLKIVSFSLMIFSVAVLSPKNSSAEAVNQISELTANIHSDDQDAEQILDAIIGEDPSLITVSEDEILDPEPDALSFFSLNLGAGSEKNVLDSSLTELDSSFTYSRFDYYYSQQKNSPYGFNFFVLAENRDYHDDLLEEDERLLITQLQGRLNLSTDSVVGIKFDYFMFQYFDQNSELTDLSVSMINNDEIAISSFWELKAESGWKGTLEGAILQNRTEQTDEDYQGLKFALSIQKSYGLDSNSVITFESIKNSYVEQEIQDENGQFITDTKLETDISSFSFKNHHVWAANNAWMTQTNLTVISKKDNGIGYLNSQGIEFSEAVNFKTPFWKIFAKVTVLNTDYPERVLDLVRDKPNLNIVLLKASGGIEKKIFGPFFVNSELMVTNSESNDTAEVYDSASLILSIGANF